MNRPAEIHAALSSALGELDDGRSAIDQVSDIPAIEAAADALIASRVAAARSEGLSWHAIAQRLGMSRQAAHKRFGTSKAKRSRSGKGGRIEITFERS